MGSTVVKSIELPTEEYNTTLTLATVTLTNGRVLKTRLLVGADGDKSIARSAANIMSWGWNYIRKGVVATVACSQHNTAWQRFLPDGPLALLPLSGNLSSIVWSTTPYHANNLLTMSNDNFVSELNNGLNSPIRYGNFTVNELTDLFGNYFPAYTPVPPIVTQVVSKRAAFPLKFSHALQYVKPRLVLIGDAAHSIHPLAGQGGNLGFSDVLSLRKVITQALETGQDVGATSLLSAYEKERKLANTLMMHGIDSLHSLYSTSFLPLAILRNAGLLLTSSLPPLKQLFIKMAQGYN